MGTEVLTEFFIEGQGGSLCAPFAGEAGTEGGMPNPAGSFDVLLTDISIDTIPFTPKPPWAVGSARGMGDGLTAGS